MSSFSLGAVDHSKGMSMSSGLNFFPSFCSAFLLVGPWLDVGDKPRIWLMLQGSAGEQKSAACGTIRTLKSWVCLLLGMTRWGLACFFLRPLLSQSPWLLVVLGWPLTPEWEMPWSSSRLLPWMNGVSWDSSPAWGTVFCSWTCWPKSSKMVAISSVSFKGALNTPNLSWGTNSPSPLSAAYNEKEHGKLAEILIHNTFIFMTLKDTNLPVQYKSAPHLTPNGRAGLAWSLYQCPQIPLLWREKQALRRTYRGHHLHPGEPLGVQGFLEGGPMSNHHCHRYHQRWAEGEEPVK